MSDPYQVGFNLSRATKFNRKYAPWPEIQIVDDLVCDFAGLSSRPGTEEFANATLELQDKLFEDDTEQDGMFGRGTWSATLSLYSPVDLLGECIVRNGIHVPVVSNTPIITWNEDGGLDLHQDGGWSRRSNKPDLIVLHWGGRNAKSCRNALASRDLSSHFGVDRLAIYQWLDTSHRAWHAGGKANSRSIGIDICQQPTIGLAKWYEDRNYGLSIIDNPSTRGAKKILTLHPETVSATADLLRVLTQAFDIPLVFPTTDRVLSKSQLARFVGIVGHHHISPRKWDVAPWLPAIREELS